MPTLGEEMKNFRSALQEHRVNAVEGSPPTVDPNQKGRQNATRFCKYCRTNGHTPSWCGKKLRDEEMKRIENERTAEKKVTFNQDYNKKRGPDYGSEQKTRGQDFRRGNENFTNDRCKRSSPTAYQSFSPRPNIVYGNNNQDMEDHMIAAQTHHSIEMMETDLEMDPLTTRMETGEKMGAFFVFRRLKGETSAKIFRIANQEVMDPTTLLSADLAIDLRLVLRPMNKSFRKTIFRRHLMWFASPQPTKPLTNNQTSVR